MRTCPQIKDGHDTREAGRPTPLRRAPEAARWAVPSWCGRRGGMGLVALVPPFGPCSRRSLAQAAAPRIARCRRPGLRSPSRVYARRGRVCSWTPLRAAGLNTRGFHASSSLHTLESSGWDGFEPEGLTSPRSAYAGHLTRSLAHTRRPPQPVLAGTKLATQDPPSR
jgi:hypothetical protein